VDAALERRALQHLQRLVRKAQAAYPDSLEDDERLVEASPPEGAGAMEVWRQKKSVIIVRMSEKLVCRELLKKVGRYLSLFDMSAESLQRNFKAKIHDRVEKSYVRDTIMKLVADETNQVSSI
jgi:hypothetical protein